MYKRENIVFSFYRKNKEIRYYKDEQIKKYYFSFSLADFDNAVQYDDEMGYAGCSNTLMWIIPHIDYE